MGSGGWTWITAPQNVQDVQSVLLSTDSSELDVFDEDGNYYTFDGAVWNLAAMPQIRVSLQSINGQPITGPIMAGTQIEAVVSEVTVVSGQSLTDVDYGGTVQVSIPGDPSVAPLAYQFPAAGADTHSFVFTLETAGSQSIVANDQVNGLSGFATLTVDPGAPYGFNIVGPGAVTAGDAASFTINSMDEFGNPVSYDGTVNLTVAYPNSPDESIGSATLSDGTGQFTTTLTTAGTPTISAAGTGPNGQSLEGDAQISVEPSSFYGIEVTVPTVVGVGVPFDATLTMVDQYGNPVTDNPNDVSVGFLEFVGGQFQSLAVSPPPDITPKDQGMLIVTMPAMYVAGSQAIAASYPGDKGLSLTNFTVQAVAPPQAHLSATATGSLKFGQADTFTTLIGEGLSTAPPETATYSVDGNTEPAQPSDGPTVTFLDGGSALEEETLTTADGVTSATLSTSLSLADGSTIVDTQAVDTADGGAASTFSTWDGTTIQGTVTSSTVDGITTYTFTTIVDDTAITGTETLNVAGGAPTASFTIEIGDSSAAVALGSITVSSSSGTTAVFTTSLLPLGPQEITAAYSGGANVPASPPSSPPVSVDVAQATTTALAESLKNPIVGQTETLTATVAASGNSGVIPTGVVTFYEGSVELGTGTLSAVGGAAVASLTTAPLAVGLASFTAVYSPDANDLPSRSAPIALTVGQQTTEIVLTATPNAAELGQSVTVTGTLTSGLAAVTGLSSMTELAVGQTVLGPGIPGGTTIEAIDSSTATLTLSAAATASGSESLTASTSVVTLTAVVAADPPGNGVPGGSVTFQEGSTTLGAGALNVVNGVDTATLIVPATILGSGTDMITAEYLGDTDDATDTSAAISVTIGTSSQMGTQTAVSLAANPIAPSLTETLTATVTADGPDASSPTGTITFLDGPKALASVGNAGGGVTASFTTVLTLPDNSTLLETQTVNTAGGGSASTSSTWDGSTITGTATSSTTGGVTTYDFSTKVDGSTVTGTEAVTTTGGVTTAAFTVSLNGSTFEGSSTLSASAGVITATDTIPADMLAEGDYPITAEYSGDSGDVGSTSGTVALTVGPASLVATQTQVVPEATYLNVGQSETLTAVVSNAAGLGIPSGTVTFYDGSVALGSAPLLPPPSGQGDGLGDYATASINSGKLASGQHVIEAVYSGADGDAGSTSPAVTVTVGEPTTINLTLPPGSPSIFTNVQSVIFTATVTGSGSAAPTGTVTLEDGGAAIETAPLTPIAGSNMASAIFTAPSLALGPQSVTAVYSGDPSNQGCTSPPVNFAVGSLTQNVTQTTLQPPSGTPQAYASVALTANVNVTVASPSEAGNTQAPTGTITFLDGPTTLGSIGSAGGGEIASFTTPSTLNGSTLLETQTVDTEGGVVSASFTTPMTVGGKTIIDTQALDTAGGGSAVTTIVNADGSTISGTATTETVSTFNGVTTANFSTTLEGSTILGTETLSTTNGVTTANFTISLNGSTVLGSETLSTTNGVSTASFKISLNGSTPEVQGSSSLSTSNGVLEATLNSTALGDGTHFLTAYYSGDMNNLASTAAPVILQVGQSTTVTALASDSIAYGQPLVTTVVILGQSSGTPSGTVTFYNGTVNAADEIGSPASLVDVGGIDTASTSALTLAPGEYTITAQYSGDASDMPSSAAAIAVKIGQDASLVSLTSTQQTVVVGSPLTLTATVTAPGDGTPTGTVTFYDGSTPLGAARPLADGVATTVFTPTSSDAATPTITIAASYSGDTNASPSSGTLAIAVILSQETSGGGHELHEGLPASTVTTMSPLGPTVFGQSVTLTATVSAGVAGVNVTFYDGASEIGIGALGMPDSNGNATATFTTTSPLSLGPHSITAVYPGGLQSNPSSSCPVPLTVSADPTQTAVTSTSSPGYAGQPETFDATVTAQSPGSGAPSGSVTFYDGTTDLGTSPLAPGGGGSVAAFTTTLSAGIHQISAVYTGDPSGDFNRSSATSMTFIVGQTGQNVTQTILSAPSVASPLFGEPEALTATVSVTQPGTNPSAVFPTGMVTFFDGSEILGTAALTISNDVPTATLTTAALPLGSSPAITAVYNGDANDMPSLSTPIGITVGPQAITATTVTASTASAVVGQPVTLIASVTEQGGGEGAMSGIVTFSDGSTVLGTATVAGADGTAMAILPTAVLAIGDHSITATYGGDANNAGSTTGTPDEVTIEQDVTDVLIVSSVSSSVYGQSVTITAIIAAPGQNTSAPTGQVVFVSGTQTLGTAAVSTSQGISSGTLSTLDLAAGTYAIQAEYSGDTTNAQSTSAAFEMTINPAPLIVSANDQTKVYGAALPTLTASYSGFVNGDTAASLTTPPALTTTADAGSPVLDNPYAITVSGAADPNYAISYAAGSLTITPAPLTITANNQTKIYGAALPTLTASYSGFVNHDNSASLATQPTLTTTATASSQVAGGPYAIAASGAVDSDYTITYVAGTFTVTPAPLTITANNQTNVYGAALPTLTLSYKGFANGDSSANLTSQPSLSTTATAGSHVAGSPYAITASDAVDSDYAITYVAGAFTVTPGTVDDYRQQPDQRLWRGAADPDGQLQRLRQRRHLREPHHPALAHDDGRRRQPRRRQPLCDHGLGRS